MIDEKLEKGQPVYSTCPGSIGERGTVLAAERETGVTGGMIPEGYTLINWSKIGREVCARDEFMTYDDVIAREA